MTLRLVTADERLAETKTTIVVFGPSKIGKTSLLWTLDPETTLFCNLEAGMKSVQGWPGTSVDVGSFTDAVNLACLIGGVAPASGADDFYSQGHYAAVTEAYGSFNVAKFKTIFWDSITDLSRLAMVWAKRQPEAFSEKKGAPDTRGAYGLLGRETVRLLRHVQHAPGKNTVFVGGLELKVDDFGRVSYRAQTEGSKTADELPFIVDQIVTMSNFDFDKESGTFLHNFGKGEIRAFCCSSPNPWGLPGGDRSGNLQLIEEPHLGRLIEKTNRPQLPPAQRLHYGITGNTNSTAA